MRTTPSRRQIALALTLALLAARPAAAQTLTDMVSDLFLFGDCAVALCMDPIPGAGPDGRARDFAVSAVQRNDDILRFLTDGVAASAGRLPLVAMGDAGEDGGLLGPVFGETPGTLGAGRYQMGLEASVLRLADFSGAPADDILLHFTNRDEASRDVLQARANLALDYAVATAVLGVGVAPSLDVGIALPVVSVRFRGSAEAQLLSLDAASEHRFGGSAEEPILSARNQVSGTSVGVGDVTARAKLDVLGMASKGSAPPGYGFGIIAAVTFPTGQEYDLLGLGVTRGSALAVFSRAWGALSSRLGAGYASGTGRSRQEGLAGGAGLGQAGFDMRASDRLALGVDVLARMELGDALRGQPGPATLPGPGELVFPASSIPDAARDLVDAAVGLKYRLRGGMTVLASGLVPIRGWGLRPDIAWTLGLQGTFR